MVSATTPALLSESEAEPWTYPVVYSPVLFFGWFIEIDEASLGLGPWVWGV